jgi:uptake hydrogenase large subunit
VPGGVTTGADTRRIAACFSLLAELQTWYEQTIIGCDLDAWLALAHADAYFELLQQPQHAESALGLLSRCAREIGLHRQAGGTANMLSFGSWDEPEQQGARILADGFFDAEQGRIVQLDQSCINEHVRHSWFRPYEGGLHPWQGETVPDFQPHSDRYSWAKAPRYGDKAAQTGPLAELFIGGDALVASLFAAEGSNAWLRQFARVRRIGYELVNARRMLNELALHGHADHIVNTAHTHELDGEGYGLLMAARGALGHWLRIKDGVIDQYQIITPTAWNASPRDSNGVRGHWEQSLLGIEVRDADDPVEIGHIIRSHDPCLVCTVHMLHTDQRFGFAP